MDVRGRVLRTLEELREGEILTFCYFLNGTIPRGKLEGASSVKLADLLFRYCPDTVLEVTAEILEKIPRKDLLPGPNFEAPPRQVSDQELMKVANHMGKRWKQIGIQYLGIKKSHLEQIEEENPGNVPMRAFYTLVGWRNHEKEKATASQLYHILNQDGVELDQEAYGFLLNST